MSMQWNAVFYILCSEILFFATLVILPARAGVWLAKVARSKTFAKVRYVMRILFYILCFFFVDSMRQMYLLESEKDANTASATSEVSVGMHNNLNMRLFRAQRNAYLTFFSVFLMLVLNRYFNVTVECCEYKEKIMLLESVAPTREAIKIDRYVAAKYDTGIGREAEAASRLDNAEEGVTDVSIIAQRNQELKEEQIKAFETDLQQSGVDVTNPKPISESDVNVPVPVPARTTASPLATTTATTSTTTDSVGAGVEPRTLAAKERESELADLSDEQHLRYALNSKTDTGVIAENSRGYPGEALVSRLVHRFGGRSQ